MLYLCLLLPTHHLTCMNPIPIRVPTTTIHLVCMNFIQHDHLIYCLFLFVLTNNSHLKIFNLITNCIVLSFQTIRSKELYFSKQSIIVYCLTSMQFMCKNHLQSPNIGCQNQPNAVNLDCNVNPGGHTDECATSKDNLIDVDATEYGGNNTGKLCCH